MNNNINTGFSEMQVLQCTSQVRNIILPFVDKLYGGMLQDETLVDSDSVAVKSKKAIPKLYRNTGIVTMFLCVAGFLLMFADAVWQLLGLNSSIYIIWCLCCLSLYFTNKLALAEWTSRNERY